jgi:hypothetical protein
MLAENRICPPLSAPTEMPIQARNLAELLRDLGLVLRRRLRAVEDRALLAKSSPRWGSQLALQFVNLRASVQLRAMVEDWPLHRIQAAVEAQRLEPLRPWSVLLIWLAAGGLAVALAAGMLRGLP